MKEIIYRYMLHHGGISRAWKTREIADAFGLSAYQTRYYLICLSREGRLLRVVFGRGTPGVWKLSGVNL